MNLNKFETIGIGVSIGAMVLALFLLRVESSNNLTLTSDTAADQAAAIIVGSEGNQDAELATAILEGSSPSGEIQRLIIDDVAFGSGPEVVTGDTISVNYIGTLQNGQEFDNSIKRGEPFTFTVGAGRVIAGWEQGVVGMKVGGQRVLVIPSDLAYGDRGAGPIPGDATLVFAIELLSIN